MGNTYIRGTQEDPNLLMEIQPLESQIKDVITSLPLSKKAHWLKIIYSQIDYKPLIVEVTMDNQGHEGLTEAIKKLNWPKHKYLYFAKQFIFVKALNEDQALPIERKDED
jgi:hypothetical protein